MDLTDIIRKSRTGSTNEDAKLFPDSAHGTVITADEQTCGKGRMGRSFYSPPGGLYMSAILTRLPEKIHLITPAAAVLVLRAIRDITGKQVLIKWVNDLFYENKKVCGILCESVYSAGGSPGRVIIGIGINLLPAVIPAELNWIAGTLGEKDPDVKEKLLLRISADIAGFDFNRAAELLDEYRKYCFLLGREVTVMAKEPYQARAAGIDDEGALAVETPAGIKILKAGEVSIKF